MSHEQDAIDHDVFAIASRPELLRAYVVRKQQLERENRELREALEDIMDTGFAGGPQGKRARAALAKVQP